MNTVNIEVLKTGPRDGLTVTREMLDSLVNNFQRLRGRVQPMLRVGRIVAGHAEDADPSAGEVVGLRRAGEKLIATLSIPSTTVREAVRAGRYRSCHPTLYRAFETLPYEANLNSGATGPVLSSVELGDWVGWQPPTVRNLDDLRQLLHAERFDEDHDDPITLRFNCAEATPRRPMTQQEKLAALEQELVEVQRNNETLRGRLARILEANMNGKRNFGAFAPAYSDDPSVSGGGTARDQLLDEVESHIAANGLDRDTVADRRKAVQAVLTAWKQGDKADLATDGITPADVVAITEKFSPSLVADADGSGQHFTRPDLARLPEGVGAPPPVSASRRTDLVPPTVSTAKRAGSPPTTSTAGAWNTPLVSTSSRKYCEAELDEAKWAATLGGEARVAHVRDVAERWGLNLKLPRDRERAEALMYAELPGSSVACATVDEAIHAAARRLGANPMRANFAETNADLMRQACEIVARERPDLVGDAYRGNPRAVPSSPPVNLAERARCFDEKVAELLREQKLPMTPQNIAKATRAIADDPAMRGLLDDYGRAARRGW